MFAFRSPTHGWMTLEQVADALLTEVRAHPHDQYRLMIGTDSQPKQSGVTFVSAVILHRVGKGAQYFIHREDQKHRFSLRQRMFTEAAYSLQFCGLLSEQLHAHGADWNLEVHLDIGEKGATKQMVREIVSWITASGYEARIKPESYGASKVADRYTKS
ncbi:ribonuclease H-like YkuK family protein [Alicyclobacillus cycloheptanicus]|jgi:predicted RNase H-related nuclease YkuK (DUF458 family)|uniref:RNase H-related nuclease YkuK (DUF458 family) n=1 Tax=Alicyclobacillus cycloheptanicus TaxID=1457 RepID=A0ABT9XK65_9BACL|nr:ribonuclease H-like YkuK family protein [Alicyclobacillus cycloheptanicus]MDQ0190173.1 putative RNase H-related nuclease YkuK (DUF458 family) [Alicyclobacillus cycloheptanicus]WDM02573.1 ribonuclease H-like YkuK family protein [Alicyclobacillus cycloheptanicus]